MYNFPDWEIVLIDDEEYILDVIVKPINLNGRKIEWAKNNAGIYNSLS